MRSKVKAERRVLSAYLPIKLNNGNDGRGGRYFSSANARKQFGRMLIGWNLRRKPFRWKTRVVITRILGKGERLWDCDSVGRGNAKELIDALVAFGWWTDDSARYIRPVDYRQDDTQRDSGPAVLIEVYSRKQSSRVAT